MSIKLINFKSDSGNVGDDFSEWLFSRLIGSKLAEESDTLLFGVGSILDESFDREFSHKDIRRKMVFGSGARRASATPSIAEGNWTIYCVRGPLTATALGISAQHAVADPGILASKFLPMSLGAKNQVGIVPYFAASHKFWEKLASRLGFLLVSPHLGVEEFFKTLNRCDRVFCESMHGAIFADSYRIPWRPLSGTGLTFEGTTHAFKWTDWTSSMGVAFDTIRIPVVPESEGRKIGAILKDELKSRFIESELKRAIREDRFLLSSDTVLDQKQMLLMDLSGNLNDDI
jgi:succinoglycan biosynthesis protein ExoV